MHRQETLYFTLGTIVLPIFSFNLAKFYPSMHWDIHLLFIVLYLQIHIQILKFVNHGLKLHKISFRLLIVWLCLTTVTS
jgi:hypothetical protein